MRVKVYGGRFKKFGTSSKYYRYEDSLKVINGIQQDVILDNNQKFAADYLVGLEVNNGLWDKIKALYGFIGGTAATHRWNWKTMLDTDAGFRLSYSGAITHNVNGIKSESNSSYANTFLNPNTVLSPTNKGLLCYRTIVSEVTAFNPALGVSDNNTLNFRLNPRVATDGRSFYEFGTGSVQINSDNVKGFHGGSSLGSANHYRINNLIANTASTQVSVPNGDIYLLAENRIGSVSRLYSLSTYGTMGITEGLTPTEMMMQNRIATTYNRILNRA